MIAKSDLKLTTKTKDTQYTKGKKEQPLRSFYDFRNMYMLSSANGKTRSGAGAESPRIQENKIPEKTLNKIIENNLNVSNRSPVPYHKSDNLEQGSSHGITSPLRVNKNIIYENDPLNHETNITKATKIFARSQYKNNNNVNESPEVQVQVQEQEQEQGQIASINDIENAKPDHFLKFQEKIAVLHHLNQKK